MVTIQDAQKAIHLQEESKKLEILSQVDLIKEHSTSELFFGQKEHLLSIERNSFEDISTNGISIILSSTKLRISQNTYFQIEEILLEASKKIKVLLSEEASLKSKLSEDILNPKNNPINHGN